MVADPNPAFREFLDAYWSSEGLESERKALGVSHRETLDEIFDM